MPPFLKKNKYASLLAVPLLVSTSVLFVPQAFAAPTANADNYTTSRDQSITVTPLSNDRADTGTTLSLRVVNQPNPFGTGTTTFSGGSVTYTPPAGWTGSTTFWYQIRDTRGNLTSAPINVTVTGNSAPTPPPVPQAFGDAVSVTAGQTIDIDAIGNDTGDAIYITRVDNPAPYPSGTAAVVNNKIRYTSPADFNGVSVFWYQIKDSLGRLTSNQITVTVTGGGTPASAHPVANSDTATTTQDQPITIAPLWNDTGSVIRIVDVNGTTTQGSKVTITGAGSLLYTPSIWSKAGDTFWYVIEDQFGRRAAARVVVAVSGSSAGSYPTAGSDNYTVDKNSKGTVLNVFANDTGSGLEFNQLFAYTQKAGRTFDNGGSVRYDAPLDFVGTDEFWYSLKDSQGRTNSAKVTITVKDTGAPTPPPEGPNDAPDAVEDILRANIGAPEFEIFVLANDTDPNGDTLTVQSVAPARDGSVRLVNGRVLYTPPNTTASDAFNYTISDGRGGTASAAATIGIVDPNNPTNNPIITGEFVTVAAGQSIVIRVLDNDTDPDGDTLILDQVTGGSQGTTEKIADDNGDLNWVRYTAIPSASGTDEFFYGVADGLGGNGSGRVSITIQ